MILKFEFVLCLYTIQACGLLGYSWLPLSISRYTCRRQPDLHSHKDEYYVLKLTHHLLKSMDSLRANSTFTWCSSTIYTIGTGVFWKIDSPSQLSIFVSIEPLKVFQFKFVLPSLKIYIIGFNLIPLDISWTNFLTSPVVKESVRLLQGFTKFRAVTQILKMPQDVMSYMNMSILSIIYFVVISSNRNLKIIMYRCRSD